MRTYFQKHLGMFLDSKLSFSEHLTTIFQKTDKAKAYLLNSKQQRW